MLTDGFVDLVASTIKYLDTLLYTAELYLKLYTDHTTDNLELTII